MAGAGRENRATLLILFKLAIFTVAAPGTVTVWLPLFVLFPEIRRQPIEPAAHSVAGVMAIAIGAAGYLWCALDFAFFGRGTPAPIDMPKFLVVRGLYKFVRNPMYISVLLVLAGEATLSWSRRLSAYTACAAVAFHLFVLLQEEPALRRKMGAAYEQYVRDVPRWIPRWRPSGRSHAL